MIYQGSKSKYADSIVPILQKFIDNNNIQCYIEPFVGGANIIDKIKCPLKIGIDKNYSLICLHQKAQENFSDIPDYVDEDLWYKAKDIYRKHKGNPSMEKEMNGWLIGAVQFLSSYNCGGFSRGYARYENINFYDRARKNLLKQSEQPEYKNIKFIYDSYKNINIEENIPTLIYCDPPYQNTKPYGYKFETDFDYTYYWNWVREKSKKHIVICSEQSFPNDFTIIWQAETKRSMHPTKKIKAIEKLGQFKL